MRNSSPLVTWSLFVQHLGKVRSQIASGQNGLLAKKGGPYKIIAKVGNAWKLELPSHFRIHPVFAETELHKYKERVFVDEFD
jgi:hypothetical protein